MKEEEKWKGGQRGGVEGVGGWITDGKIRRRVGVAGCWGWVPGAALWEGRRGGEQCVGDPVKLKWKKTYLICWLPMRQLWPLEGAASGVKCRQLRYQEHSSSLALGPPEAPANSHVLQRNDNPLSCIILIIIKMFPMGGNDTNTREN